MELCLLWRSSQPCPRSLVCHGNGDTGLATFTWVPLATMPGQGWVQKGNELSAPYLNWNYQETCWCEPGAAGGHLVTTRKEADNKDGTEGGNAEGQKSPESGGRGLCPRIDLFCEMPVQVFCPFFCCVLLVLVIFYVLWIKVLSTGICVLQMSSQVCGMPFHKSPN